MTIQSARLRISTPTEPIAPGRGFYQLEEDALYVQIGAFAPQHRFFSYLESEFVSLQFDRNARLIFIEVTLPRRGWKVDNELIMPSMAELADIRWLDFREAISEPQLTTNKTQTRLHLQFTHNSPWRSFHISDNVILQTDDNDHLAAIWIDDIEDDLAGQEIAAFRKQLLRRHQSA
ncbi:MAG: hypothetical protein KAW46_02890 [candidate division Zixibacteria bacterium]|nr:hypothetical protein [candidate division Zixibacteria bacterium]